MINGGILVSARNKHKNFNPALLKETPRTNRVHK